MLSNAILGASWKLTISRGEAFAVSIILRHGLPVGEAGILHSAGSFPEFIATKKSVSVSLPVFKPFKAKARNVLSVEKSGLRGVIPCQITSPVFIKVRLLKAGCASRNLIISLVKRWKSEFLSRKDQSVQLISLS